ncbi:MAG: O-antigen ligase family protein, partial [Geminicoccaceae bacterium]
MTAMARSEAAGRYEPYLLLATNALILFWLIVTSGAIFPLLTLGDGSELDEAARSKLRLLLLPGLALAPLLFLLRFREVSRLFLRNPPLSIIVVWAAISIVWSIAPDLTGRRVIGLVTSTLIAGFLVVDRDVDRLLRFLSWCFFILLAASVAFIVLLPGLAVMEDGRGLRGAFLHKNSLGETAAVGLIVLFASLRTRAISRSVGLAGMGLALILLFSAGAVSSIVAGTLVLCIQVFFLTDVVPFRQRLIILTFGAAAACVVIGGIVANLDAILGILGRDATLTGRTDIWAYVLHMSAQRPWLGYGYAAFFEAEPIAQYVMDRFDWSIPTAHNGYLETLLSLGWIGLVLLLTFFLTMAFRLASNWR